MTKNILPLGSVAYKLHLDHLCPKDVPSHNYKTLTPIFANRTLFSPELKGDFNKIMKSQKVT